MKIHEKGIILNNIKLSNIFFVEKEIKIGLPYLHSLEKYQRRERISKGLSSRYWFSAPEISSGGLVGNEASDVWDLGFVFLQIFLDKVYEKNSATDE